MEKKTYRINIIDIRQVNEINNSLLNKWKKNDEQGKQNYIYKKYDNINYYVQNGQKKKTASPNMIKQLYNNEQNNKEKKTIDNKPVIQVIDMKQKEVNYNYKIQIYGRTEKNESIYVKINNYKPKIYMHIKCEDVINEKNEKKFIIQFMKMIFNKYVNSQKITYDEYVCYEQI